MRAEREAGQSRAHKRSRPAPQAGRVWGRRSLQSLVRSHPVTQLTHATQPAAAVAQIADSLRRFGLSDDSSSLLVARFDASPEDMAVAETLVDGELQPVECLAAVADQAVVIKVRAGRVMAQRRNAVTCLSSGVRHGRARPVPGLPEPASP